MTERFREAVEAAGLNFTDDIIADGKLHRVHVGGDRPGSKNGWYVFHIEELPAGAFGCWKRDISEKWASRDYSTLTDEERAQYAARMEAARQQHREEKERFHAECRKWCENSWNNAKEASTDHPYLKIKGIKPYGVKQQGESLLVPLRDSAGIIHGMQFISADGSKKFKTGTAKKGNYFSIGKPKEKTTLVCEGYATAASLHEATGQTVIVAFDAGNLQPVAVSIRTKFPDTEMIICADNDQSGVGQKKAREAALAVTGLLAIPPTKGEDYNDIFLQKGAEAVQQSIKAATSPEQNSTEYSGQGWFVDALAKASVARFIDHDPPELDWIFKETLLAGTAGFLVGPGAAGKSTLAILMLMAIATGRDILRGIFTPSRPGRALGVFGEDDETVLHHRVHTMAQSLFEHDPEALALLRKNLLIVTTTGKDVRFISQENRDLQQSDFFSTVSAAVDTVEDLRLIILDPVSRFHGAEENDNSAGTFLVSLMEQIGQKTGAAVLFLHHVTKRAGFTQTGFDLDAAMQQDVSRGASGLTNGGRWQCNLFGLPEKDCKKLISVNDAKPGEYLALKVSKKNFGPPEEVNYLKRYEGGLICPFEPPIKEKDEDLEKLIKGFAIDAVFENEGRKLTKRKIIDGYQSEWKERDHRITRAAVEQTINACIVSGELCERKGKNDMGKTIVYLSCYPEPDEEKDAVS